VLGLSWKYGPLPNIQSHMFLNQPVVKPTNACCHIDVRCPVTNEPVRHVHFISIYPSDSYRLTATTKRTDAHG